MRLRPATATDRPLLEHWDRQPHVRSATGDDGGFDWATELPRSLDWRELLIAEVAGRPVGFVQIIDPAREETQYWGDVASNLRAIDMWIGAAADLGQGYGAAIMQAAIARCFAEPAVEAILLDPLTTNVRAQRFYARLGFQPVERRRFGTDDGLVMRLDRHHRP